ncbi:MAG: FAD-dependent oxidoreductase, partial [Myxococcales bacterium]
MRSSSFAAPEPPSAWLADAPVGDPRPPLDADTGADVCIIGAGMTGLSSALALRADGLDVVLLDADTAGFGASGRNAGHVTPTIGKDLPTLARMYGAERVAGLIELQETAISHVERLIA